MSSLYQLWRSENAVPAGEHASGGYDRLYVPQLEQGTLALTTGKTHRRQILPLAKPLRGWIEQKLPGREGVGDEPLFPTLISNAGRIGTCAHQFHRLIDRTLRSSQWQVSPGGCL
jgi:hypothetical protein